MYDTPTPGQLAYEAFNATWHARGERSLLAWDTVSPPVRAAWEAAAQAVLAGQEEQRDGP